MGCMQTSNASAAAQKTSSILTGSGTSGLLQNYSNTAVPDYEGIGVYGKKQYGNKTEKCNGNRQEV
ncbi:hypothetical protein SAMN04487934_10285 [Eubacterium ruminantium]|nr:hypothetical protein SAMN04487934_10285 [Eubacterium ruminantium]